MTIISMTTKTAITDPAMTPALLLSLERSSEVAPVKPQIKQERFSKVNGRPTSFTLSVRYTLRFDRPILDTLWWLLKIQYETNLDM